MQLSTILMFAFALPAFASQLDTRATYAAGGFGLSSSTCPSNTVSFTCGVCCPNGLSVPDTCAASPGGTVCCPPGSSCAEALEATPFCADSSWILWNTTTGGLFCCTKGQIGTNSLQCVNGNTVVAATLSASMIGQPIPTGAAAGTLAASGVDSTSHTGTQTGTAAASHITKTVVATTTKNGIASIITSLIADATSHSDSWKVRPLGGEFTRSSWSLSFTGVIAGLLGLVAFTVRAL